MYNWMPTRLLPRQVATRWILGALALLLQLTAHAQASLTPPPFSPVITVTPLVAGPGVTRTITLTATWHDACPPGNAEVIVNTLPTVEGITIRLYVPLTLVACAQVLTPYTASVTYTPARPGVEHIAVALHDGRFLGSGQITTLSAGQPRPAFDLTGAWYDANTSGSGIAFYHAQSTTNVMAGAFYGFDTAGKAHWYLIQNVRWTNTEYFGADLIEVEAASGACPPEVAGPPACAKVMRESRRVGYLNGEVLNADQLKIGLRNLIEFDPIFLPPMITYQRVRF